MFWGRDEPFFATNDMCYLHEVVVDNISEVIGRKAIRFENDKVFFGVLLLEMAIYSIAEFWLTKRVALETHDVCFSRGSTL